MFFGTQKVNKEVNIVTEFESVLMGFGIYRASLSTAINTFQILKEPSHAFVHITKESVPMFAVEVYKCNWMKN